MRRFVSDNALSLTMFGLFLVFWAAQSVSGWHAANADNREHHQPAESYPSYLTTGHSWRPRLRIGRASSGDLHHLAECHS